MQWYYSVYSPIYSLWWHWHSVSVFLCRWLSQFSPLVLQFRFHLSEHYLIFFRLVSTFNRNWCVFMLRFLRRLLLFGTDAPHLNRTCRIFLLLARISMYCFIDGHNILQFFFDLLPTFSMPALRWYEPSRPALRSRQGPRRHTKPPQLSKEARAAIKERRHDNQLKYNTALAKTVFDFEKAASDVASTHHKSIRRVEQDVRLNSDLLRKRQKKSNAWNAWVWYKSQDKENLGTALRLCS